MTNIQQRVVYVAAEKKSTTTRLLLQVQVLQSGCAADFDEKQLQLLPDVGDVLVYSLLLLSEVEKTHYWATEYEQQ